MTPRHYPFLKVYSYVSCTYTYSPSSSLRFATYSQAIQEELIEPHLLHFVLSPAANDRVASVPHEQLRYPESYPRAPSRDERNFSLEQIGLEAILVAVETEIIVLRIVRHV